MSALYSCPSSPDSSANKLLQALICRNNLSYRSHPSHQLWVWSRVNSNGMPQRYEPVLQQDPEHGLGVCVNNEWLRQFAPSCLLTVLSLVEHPEPLAQQSSRVDIRLDQLDAHDLMALHDLFGRECPIVMPFHSEITNDAFEFLVHYLDLSPFHLARNLHPLSPTVWFKPYSMASGSFSFTSIHGVVRVDAFTGRVESMFPIVVSETDWHRCTSMQLTELSWFVEPPPPADSKFNKITRNAVVSLSAEEYSQWMKARLWQRVIPSLMQEQCGDPFLAQFVTKNCKTLIQFARNDELLLLKSKPRQMRTLMVQSCWRYDSLRSMCLLLRIRRCRNTERLCVWLFAASFTNWVEIQELRRFLFGKQRNRFCTLQKDFEQLFNLAVQVDNHSLVQSAFHCVEYGHLALSAALNSQNMQHALAQALHSELAATTLHRLLAAQPLTEALQWTESLALLVFQNARLLKSNEGKCLIALVRFIDNIPIDHFIFLLHRIDGFELHTIYLALSRFGCEQEYSRLLDLDRCYRSGTQLDVAPQAPRQQTL